MVLLTLRDLQAGRGVDVDVEGDDTIQAVKMQVEAREGIPAAAQQLVFHGTNIPDSVTIGELGLQNGETIQLVYKLQSEQPSEPPTPLSGRPAPRPPSGRSNFSALNMPTEINMAGKTVPVFTEQNLESMNPQNLRMRGLDLKDLLQSMGGGNVPMPRHKEALRDWILQTQQTLLGMPGGAGGTAEMGGSAGMGGALSPGRMSGAGMGNLASARGAGGYAPSESAMTEDQEAYMAARAGANASRQRNQGSANIFTWS
jgi:hypothetical protein